MTRRSLLAALFGALAAKFLPKAKAGGMAGLFNPRTEIPTQYFCGSDQIQRDCRALTQETEIVSKLIDMFYDEGRKAVSEEMLHYLGFKFAAGTGYYQDGVLSFTEEYPNRPAFIAYYVPGLGQITGPSGHDPKTQGAETPVRHEAT